MKYSNQSLFIYFFFFSILNFTFFNILNFTFKTPNDGALYVAAADYFLNNGILINPISSYKEIITPFPTSQIGIVFVLAVLKILFGQYWNFAYIFLIAVLWSFSFNYILNFINKLYKDRNILFSILFGLIIFTNYDNLNTSSSYYNESIYYPIYLIIFVKILKCLNNNTINKLDSLTIILFLCLLCFFRLQNLVFIGSICFYLIYEKKYKVFLKFFIFIIITLITLYFLIKYLPTVTTNQNSESYLFINIYSIRDIVEQLKIDFFKNIKVQLAMYSHFSNITKVVNIIIPRNFFDLKEFFYLLFSLSIISIFIYQYKFSKFRKIYKFFLIYILLTHLFSFFIFDQDTRYYLYMNIVILIVIYDFILNTFKVKKIRSVLLLIFIPIVFLLIYGVGYFININKHKNVYVHNKTIRNLVSNRGSYFDDKEIFISNFAYPTFWLTKRPTFTINHFFKSEINKRNPDLSYFFVGSKDQINNLKNNKLIDSFSQVSLKVENNYGIWKIVLNDKN